jgi:mandelate racemase
MSRDSLTIRSVEARPVVVPLSRPVVSKVGLFHEWPLILIDLQTEEGVVGRSYLEPYLAKAMRYIVPAIHDIVDAIKDRPIAPHDAYLSSRKSLGLVGLQGVTMIAVAGVDMALWDARARAAGLPLATYLGGSLAPVPAYNSNGLWLIPLEEIGAEAAALAAEGDFTALKLRLGRDRIADDIAAIAAVRDAAGADVKLLCDFNQALSLGDALHRCHGLDDQGLTWFEEPIAYDNLTGYAELKRALKTPIQLGENFYGPRSLYEAIQADAGSYVMPDLMRIGGVSGWMRAAAIAGAAGIQMSSHLYPEFSAHLLRVTDTAHWLEWQDWAEVVLAEPYARRDGHLVIPDKPGAGLEWNEGAVARHRVDG